MWSPKAKQEHTYIINEPGAEILPEYSHLALGPIH